MLIESPLSVLSVAQPEENRWIDGEYRKWFDHKFGWNEKKKWKEEEQRERERGKEEKQKSRVLTEIQF